MGKYSCRPEEVLMDSDMLYVAILLLVVILVLLMPPGPGTPLQQQVGAK